MMYPKFYCSKLELNIDKLTVKFVWKLLKFRSEA